MNPDEGLPDEDEFGSIPCPSIWRRAPPMEIDELIARRIARKITKKEDEVAAIMGIGRANINFPRGN
jgi:hypothetical protein